jgi:citrate lyase subunit beta/citryl-CoA lyase
MLFENIDFFEEKDLSKYIKKIKKRDKPKIENPKTSIMVPANKPRLLNKIDTLETQILTLNLEDGVSVQEKPKALQNIELLLSKLPKDFSKYIVVRVNELNNGGIKEIKRLNKVKPHGIRVPKIKTKKDLKKILKLVDKNIDIHITIETKEALDNLHKFGFNSRIKVAYLGILDLLESLDIPQEILNKDNQFCNYLLSKFLFDCKIANIYPVSFVLQNYQDLKDFENWCKYEKSLGFTAKNCITPNQLKIANEVFSTKNDLVEKSLYIKKIFEENQKNGITGFKDEKYGFIDEPIYKNALVVLNQKN